MSRSLLYLVGAGILILSTAAAGWETDLHYGLTKWLAFQAGFNLEDAEVIAHGTQEPDDGKLYPAPVAVFEAACLGHRNEDLSRLVQTYHFPSYGPVPGAPPKRVVSPGSAPATALVQKEIQTNLPNEPREKTLEHLGVALHPLEDSWAHQGEPGIPWTCSQDLAYGHPSSRGGWRKHDADLTYLHQLPDTVDTAHLTYDLLVSFLANHPKLRSHPAIPWKNIQGQVTEFAKAASKEAKTDWFKSQANVPFSSYTSNPDFLRSINLPDKNSAHADLAPRFLNVSQVQFRDPGLEIPKDLQEFVNKFLTTWIADRSPRRALDLTDPKGIAAPFMASSPQSDPPTLTEGLLGMWLVRDHGLVNAMGHGSGNSAEFARFRDLPQIEAGSLNAAIEGSEKRAYDIIPVDGGKEDSNREAFGVIFQFRHCPRDAVILIVRRDVAKGWVVSRLMWWIL